MELHQTESGRRHRVSSCRGRVHLAVAAVALVLVAAACSSMSRHALTVQGSGQSPSGGGGPLSSAGGQAAAAIAARNGLSANAGSHAGSNANTGSAGSGAGSNAASSPGGGLGTPAGSPHLATGPGAIGVTDTTVSLGFLTADATQFAAAATAVGYNFNPSSYQNIDATAETMAIVNYVNAHGGLAGRKIVPVFYKTNIQNLVTRSGREQEAQSACATYTEDHHVFSFNSSKSYTEDNIIQCAIDHKTVLVDTYFQGAQLTRSRLQQAVPYWYGLSKMLAERREQTQVDELAKGGYFDKGAKVGVLTENVPMSKESFAKGLRPALAAHGIPVTAEAVYPDVIDSPWQNYVLQFEQAGVNHVLFSTSTYEWWTGVMFMRAAESQGYHPRYGLTTDVDPGGDFPSNAPKAQLNGALAVGWIPQADTGAQLSGPQYALCMKIEKDAGQEGLALGPTTCEYLNFLQAALSRAPEFSASGLEAGAAALGKSFQSIWVPLEDFGAGRFDGVSEVRTTAFDNSCGCFNKYNSPPTPASQ